MAGPPRYLRRVRRSGCDPGSARPPVLRTFPCTHACAHYPGRPLDVHRSITPAQRSGLPQIVEGSASTACLSGPAQASLALQPACLLNPLSEAFCLGASRPQSPRTAASPDSYRGVSTIPRAGLAPAGEGAPSRRTTNSRPDLTSGREEVRRAIGSPAAMLIGLEPGASNH